VNEEKWFSRYDKFYELLDKLVPDNAHILIIGANDGRSFDPIARKWKLGWTGYFVEPNPIAMERLKKNRKNDKAVFIPYAVGERKSIVLHTMTEEAGRSYFKDKKMQHGTLLTSFSYEHIVIRLKKKCSKLIKEKGLGNLVKSFEVECKTIEQLVEEYNMRRVDLVQIDTEGMDGEITRMLGRSSLSPQLVLSEHNHLSNDERRMTKECMRIAGYRHFEDLKIDTVFWK